MHSFISKLVLILLLYAPAARAQSPFRKLTAQKIGHPITIDGILNEPDWKTAPVADHFTELRPNTFAKEESADRTEVFFLYNNEGLYIGGHCYERKADSVATELVGRDNFGNNDFIGLVFDTYYDQINGTEYFVTPLGEQMDAKIVPPNQNGNSEDFSWSSVWQSASKLTSDGWTFEIFLPYSALRFSKKDQQLWGMNLVRKRNKSGKQLFWNPIDPQKNGFLTQEGTLTIPDKITPPLRLSFTPYFSTYLNHYPYNTPGEKNTSFTVNGGMDVKYGINESFTLDATLIPDFGQVQSDNHVLNTTPFEVKYNENRSFFTEGTELFNKGGLFYSRRIGSQPLHYWDVQDGSNPYAHIQPGEHFVENPQETKLLNATKLSGRTKQKLGIGLFNAITENTYALVEDPLGNKHKILTNPLTNYNILVLDQSLKNNSSVTLVNTSVLRSGHDYDADVVAGLFNLFDKKNKWNLSGNAYSSNLFYSDRPTSRGYKYGIGGGKVSGAFNFNAAVQLIDDKFDPNDMGLQFFNNDINYNLWVGYAITRPHRWYNRWFNNININYDQYYKPYSYKGFVVNFNSNLQLKNLWWLGSFGNANTRGNDLYESRVNGRIFKNPGYYSQGLFLQTNEAKKYYVNYVVMGGAYMQYGGRELYTELTHRYRFSNKLSVEHYIQFDPLRNNVGFANVKSADTVLFGQRSRNTIENRLSVKYSFSNTQYITFRLRHYWSKVENNDFFTLNTDGTLSEVAVANQPLNRYINDNNRFNQNFNTFNIDLVYSWRFAPGSEFNIVWKNAIGSFSDITQNNYFKNLNHILATPQNNSLSLKVLYYIDYNKLRRKS